ncbi:vesicle transport protein USE1 isoform X2 [Glossina fuscipes]|uniref:Vesicle transport protein USE1 n=2 Tax=Nemorhina TaxID=44051 RepID=A0A8U0W8T0_9MUSC|nr:vesicle transport protein USE1 isoform X2 [Glossina fuscipes]
MAAKLNVNIRTLLNDCEELAADKSNYWRLRKFIKSLDIMIQELSDMDENEKVPIYNRRLDNLKAKINYIESSPQANNLHAVRQRGAAAESGDDALREIRQLQATKQYAEERRELLEESVRKRKPLQNDSGEQSEAVKYMRENQKKITEHMLSLTRNLKQQTVTANQIIKKDTEMVSHSSGMADRNIGALNKETEKLEDHSRNAWKCWMWMMITFVIVTFIGMVLFMKIVKKKKY